MGLKNLVNFKNNSIICSKVWFAGRCYFVYVSVWVCVFTNCDTRLNAISQQVRVINFFFYPTGVQRSLTTSLLKINYLFAIDLFLSLGGKQIPTHLCPYASNGVLVFVFVVGAECLLDWVIICSKTNKKLFKTNTTELFASKHSTNSLTCSVKKAKTILLFDWLA